MWESWYEIHLSKQMGENTPNLFGNVSFIGTLSHLAKLLEVSINLIRIEFDVSIAWLGFSNYYYILECV